MKKVYLGSDHNGFKLKQKIMKFLDEKKIQYKDLGNKKLDKKDDYPDYAYKVGVKVAKEDAKGILLCGSAQGVAIAANKVPGIRAVPLTTVKEAKDSREDDDANILCLSGWYLTERDVKKIVNAWLRTKFSGAARHKRRIKKIAKIEERCGSL